MALVLDDRITDAGQIDTTYDDGQIVVRGFVSFAEIEELHRQKADAETMRLFRATLRDNPNAIALAHTGAHILQVMMENGHFYKDFDKVGIAATAEVVDDGIRFAVKLENMGYAKRI